LIWWCAAFEGMVNMVFNVIFLVLFIFNPHEINVNVNFGHVH